MLGCRLVWPKAAVFDTAITGSNPVAPSIFPRVAQRSVHAVDNREARVRSPPLGPFSLDYLLCNLEKLVICNKCSNTFPVHITIDNKKRNLCNRTLCLECLPFKEKKPGKRKKRNTYAAVKRFRHNQKQKAVLLMGGSCKLCGYNKINRNLVFHHLDPKQKDYAMRDLQNKSWKLVVKELQKCVLLCHNCHGEVHEGTVSL